MQNSGKGIFETLQSVIAYFAPPVATVFLLGIAWRRATAVAARCTLYVGSAISLSIGVMDLSNWPWKGFWPHFMLMTVYLFLFCMTLMIVVSLLTKHARYEEDFGDARRLDTSAGRKGAGRWAGFCGQFSPRSWSRSTLDSSILPRTPTAQTGQSSNGWSKLSGPSKAASSRFYCPAP